MLISASFRLQSITLGLPILGIFLLVGYSKEEVNELRDQLEEEDIRV